MASSRKAAKQAPASSPSAAAKLGESQPESSREMHRAREGGAKRPKTHRKQGTKRSKSQRARKLLDEHGLCPISLAPMRHALPSRVALRHRPHAAACVWLVQRPGKP